MSESIKFTAAACLLAKAIYYARSEAFDLDVVHWDALDHTSKRLYVGQAQEVLNANRPIGKSSLLGTFAAVTRQHAAKVVGTIQPKEQNV